MTTQSAVPNVANGAARIRSFQASRISVSMSALTDSASAVSAPA